MRFLPFVAALLSLAPAAAAAQSPTIKEETPGLMAQARITGDSALRIAQGRVPKSTMKSGELEKEHGKLVFSFDLAVTGKSGIEEVQVDAVTGAVVSQEHESAKDEAKEAHEHDKPKDKQKPATPKP